MIGVAVRIDEEDHLKPMGLHPREHIFGLLARIFSGNRLRFVAGNDPGLHAGPVELGIPEVLRFPSRLVEEDQENLLAAGAAKMVDLPGNFAGDA